MCCQHRKPPKQKLNEHPVFEVGRILTNTKSVPILKTDWRGALRFRSDPCLGKWWSKFIPHFERSSFEKRRGVWCSGKG